MPDTVNRVRLTVRVAFMLVWTNITVAQVETKNITDNEVKGELVRNGHPPKVALKQ